MGSNPIERDDEASGDDKEQRRHRHEDDVVHGKPRGVESELLGLDQRVKQVGEQREKQHAAGYDHGDAPVAWVWRMAKCLIYDKEASVGRCSSKRH